MKTILKSMLISLLTGASFTIGVIVIMICYQIFEERQVRDDRTLVESPIGLDITEHSLLPETERLTVIGVVVNNTDYAWHRFDLEVAVYAGNALINKCNDWTYEIDPGESRRFETDCYDISGRDLPENIRYEIGIGTAWRYTKQFPPPK